jgi:hypothetical protein
MGLTRMARRRSKRTTSLMTSKVVASSRELPKSTRYGTSAGALKQGFDILRFHPYRVAERPASVAMRLLCKSMGQNANN